MLYRVTYTTSGLKRRVRTVDGDTLEWLRGAWHTGMRVVSSREATEKESSKGAYTGVLNA
jgi:hypothetical protein